MQLFHNAVLFVALLGWFAQITQAMAERPAFPRFGAEKVIRGELVEADFIHRSGKFRAADGELRQFTLLPCAVMTYRGAEADLREVPLGAELDFLLLPDDEGQLTQLVGARHGAAADENQRQRFVEFTKARGLAGWIDRTSGKTLTVTFFSSAPSTFDANWGDDFDVGAAVTVCVANHELRTWQPTSTGERGTIVAVETVPVEGHGCSGRRVVIQVGNMLEGFRQGRVVRVFGNGWKVRNQLYQECLINYGYQGRGAPDFRECAAQHYPEQFPYRTDYGNRHLPWFQVREGSPPPQYAEHRLFGELTLIDSSTSSGEFRVEGSDQVVKFTMLNTGARQPAIRFQTAGRESANSRMSSLALGERYLFHMFQDSRGAFTRCSFITDHSSQMVMNSYNYQLRKLDLDGGQLEVAWQPLPVKNYQGDMETPPPYGHSLLRITPETRSWQGQDPLPLSSLEPKDLLRVNLTADFPGKRGRCCDVWRIDLQAKKK